MRARLRSALARTAQAAGLLVVFAGSLAGAVALHADLPPARRAVGATTERLLAGLFEGSFVVQDVERLVVRRTTRVRIERVDVLDKDGRTAITALGVDAQLDLVTLLRSLAVTGTPNIVVDVASIDGAEVVLDRDVDGGLRLAHAFRSRTAAPPATAPAPVPVGPPPAAAPPPRLRIRGAKIAHAWVHGDVAPGTLDLDARDVRADVSLEHDVVGVVLHDADVVLRAPSLPIQALPLTGKASGKLDVAVVTTKLLGSATFAGETGGLPVRAEATVDGDRVTAKLDIPTTEPSALAHAFPLVALAQPASLTATARGAWPSLSVDARATIGAGTVATIADVDLRGPVTFTGVVTASRVDLQAFGGPPSNLSAKLSGTAAVDAGNVFGTFRLTGEKGEVAGETIPPIVADGRFENRTLAVSARAEEPGVRAAANVVVDVPTRALTFDVQTRAADLRAVPRLRGAVSGSASARATGKVDLAQRTVASLVTATTDAVSDGTTKVGSATVTAYVSGPLRSPVADARVEAKNVQFATGGKAPLLYPSVSARARIAIPSLAMDGVDVRAATSEHEPEEKSLVAHADRVSFAKGGVVVQGGRVEGLGGALELSAETSRGGVHLRARGQGLELERAAAATGLSPLRSLPKGTRADVDVDVAYLDGRAQGHVDLRVQNGSGFEGELLATLDRGRARGSARLALAPFGEVRARSFEVELPGPLDRPATFQRATGAVELDGEVDLASGAALLAGESVQAITGKVSLTARLERSGPEAMPTARATVTTHGLSVTRDEGGKSVTYAGVDLTAHAAWDGLTDDVEAALVLWDKRAALATADAKAKLPVGAWLRGTALPSREAFADVGVELRADIPRRQFRSLPDWLVPARLEGGIEGTLTSSGPLAHPQVAGLLRGLGLRDKNRGRNDPVYGPVDASVDLRWDGGDVVAVVTADEQALPRDVREAARGRGRETKPRGLGSARGLVLARASARELLVRGADPGFRASAELSADKIDLAPLPLPYNARGSVSGRFSVRDVNGSPSFNANARFTDLVLANAQFGSGDVVVGGRDKGLFGVARLTQHEGGTAQLQVVSQALRLQGRSVSWDDEATTRLDYSLQNVRLSVLRPVVRRMFPEVDGRLDGRGSVTILGNEQTFEGGAAISDGRLYVNLLGEEVTNVQAMVHFERNGVFRVQDASGRIGEGDLRASMTGRMKGLRFMGANASVVIPSKRGIPLSTEGATYAEATGQANLQMVMSEDRSTLLCAVDVPAARVELPERSTQSLQSTEDEPSITIGRRRPDGSLAPIQLHQRGARAAQQATAATRRARRKQEKDAPSAALPEPTVPATPPADASERDLVTRFTISIGRGVWIEGRGMHIASTGLLLVEVGGELSVTGRVDLTEGTVDVQGRRFTIDRGTLTFLEDEEPTNPTVLASAYWDAPDGTRVWAEFADPFQTGKLTLRSEPPYSYNEILSLLLFGRPEGNIASTGSTGVAGGVVAPGLNRALEQLAGGEVEIRANVGTTRFQQQSRPEIEVRRGRVGVTVGYVVGVPSLVQPDTTLLTIDWQFLPRWSVAATRGNASTTILDVLYRYRY